MKSEDYWELFFTLNLKKQTILDTLFSKNIFSLKKKKKVIIVFFNANGQCTKLT